MKYKVTLHPLKNGLSFTTKEPVLWCVHNFGPVSDRWDWHVKYDSTGTVLEFTFGNQSDFTQFSLAWL